MDKVWGGSVTDLGFGRPCAQSYAVLMSVTKEEAGRCDGYTAAMAVNTCDTTLSRSHTLMFSIFATEGK